MRSESRKLYDILSAARRNAIWSSQGQNSVTTNRHIGTTLHLIEVALAILNESITANPTK